MPITAWVAMLKTATTIFWRETRSDGRYVTDARLLMMRLIALDTEHKDWPEVRHMTTLVQAVTQYPNIEDELLAAINGEPRYWTSPEGRVRAEAFYDAMLPLLDGAQERALGD